MPRLMMATLMAIALPNTANTASAAVTVNVPTTGVVVVEATGSDQIVLLCKGDGLFINGVPRGNLCGTMIRLVVLGGDGANTIQLSGLLRADTPQLSVIEVRGGFGDDVIVGSDIANIAQEILDGGRDNDTIHGGDGNDTILGGAGDDILNGGAGNDQLNGGPGNDLYRYLSDGGGIDTIIEQPGEGNNDRATFTSNKSGDYTITPSLVERGAKGSEDRLAFDVRFCAGGENDGVSCVDQSDCRSIDRVIPNDGVCEGFVERVTILGDSPIKGDDSDTYKVFPSRSTIFTIADLGPSPGDVLIYDHRLNQPACPADTGTAIVTDGGVLSVFHSGIESIIIRKADCQAATCDAGDNVGLVCFDNTDCPGGTCVPAGNTFEDGCELLDGGAFDCGGEGIPDVCQEITDCNRNGRSDVCDPDSDADGKIDDCDNCPNVPNGPSLGTCMNAGAPAPTCANDAECDSVPAAGDGDCDNDQLDSDGDGNGDVCDDCVSFCNPRICIGGENDGRICELDLERDECPGGVCQQLDANNNQIGDACEVRIGTEYPIPPAPSEAEGCNPLSPVPCTCIDYSTVSRARTSAAIFDATCNGGNDDGGVCLFDADCTPGGVCEAPLSTSVDPPQAALYYAETVGPDHMFVTEKALANTEIPVDITWLDSADGLVGIPIRYFVTSELPTPVKADPPNGIPSDIDVVKVPRNLILNPLNTYSLTISTNRTPLIIFNSHIRAAHGTRFDDLNFSPSLNGFSVVLNPTIDTEYVAVLWLDGALGGPVDGVEILDIRDFAFADHVGDVGTQLPIPTGADCRADLFVNTTTEPPASVTLGWQRLESPLDVWYQRPTLGPADDLQIVWLRRSNLEGHCWPVEWTRHEANWPTDPQHFVVDRAAASPPMLVDLPLGDTEPYCSADAVYQQPADGSVALPKPKIENNMFTMEDPGWTVVRFDIKAEEVGCADLPGTVARPTRTSVIFEVIQGFDRTDDTVFIDAGADVLDQFACDGGTDDTLPCTVPSDCRGGACVRVWNIGTQIDDPSHSLSTRLWPFGYLHIGQPFAPCIYNDGFFGCLAGTATGQIFPVNSGDAHGTLEPWWFQEGRFAPGIFWPHKVGVYDPVWPVTDDPTDPRDDPFDIVIASRIGAGDYPDGAEVYHRGDYATRVNDANVLEGWNPNDEHARVLSGRVYAVRDDNPWQSASGHPYVIVKYRDPPPPLTFGAAPIPWNMGVHRVVGEDAVDTFDYTHFATESGDPITVVAGMPIDPLFPVNFGGVAACLDGGAPPQPLTSITTVCLGGTNDGSVCATAAECTGGGICTDDALFVDRIGVIWGIEGFPDDVANPLQFCKGGPNDGNLCVEDADCQVNLNDVTSVCRGSAAAILLYENWAEDVGCQPWRANEPVDGAVDATQPFPIVYRPGWPSTDCNFLTDPTCPRPLKIGQTIVDQTGQCGRAICPHNSAGVKLLDSTRLVRVPLDELPPEVDFRNLPPHLFAGTIGGSLPFPDRIKFLNRELIFRGVMSDRDRDIIKSLSPDGLYQTAIDDLQVLSHAEAVVDCTEVPPTDVPEEKFVSAAIPTAKEGWVSLVFANDDACAPVGSPDVQIWRVTCGPYEGEIRVLTPTCPFNEKQVLQHTPDAGGQPEGLFYHWQWSESQDGPWFDYAPPSEFLSGQGLREVVIGGPSPFTLADSWWRVRYRGYVNCACTEGLDCLPVCNDAPEFCNPDDQIVWPNRLGGDDTMISKWTEPQLAEGWIKRVLRGLNPFDQRVRDFHTTAVATYVSLIQQAGNRFEAPIALNCTPSNINNIGLIEAYTTVLRRARLFSIDVGVSYDPANLAIMLVTNQIAELYMLLGNEAFADALDPTIGFFGDTPPADPTAAFSFEGQVPNLLEEELGMLRGRSDPGDNIKDADQFVIATPYNRLLWNFLPGNAPGRVAYANNYQTTTEPQALGLYPQGHGDAWGHYLTSVKSYYQLLRHPVFEWVNSTEFVLIAGQQPLEVTYQYERKFAQAAAAKAKTGAAITSLTFRELYTADATKQVGYPDPSTEFPTRKWGVADWARRAGRGAYFDWVLVNALVDDDDDDPDHQNTIQKVDRSTIQEIREISAAFGEMQDTLDNADNGLNPLGLANNVVPFGLDPEAIAAGKTHFDQVFERALDSASWAVRVFNYANDNTRRLRSLQNDVLEFQFLTEEREMDFTNRLIEVFGRPYPETVGPGKTYSTDECPDGQCPDIIYFNYIDASRIAEFGFPQTIDPTSTSHSLSFTYRDRKIDPVTGAVVDTASTSNDLCNPAAGGSACGRIVDFNVDEVFGVTKPDGWGQRPEPGAIQQSKTKLVQATGKYVQAYEAWRDYIDRIQCAVDTLTNVYAFQAEEVSVKSSLRTQTEAIRTTLLGLRVGERVLGYAKSALISSVDVIKSALPKVVGAGFTVVVDPTFVARGALEGGKKIGVKVIEALEEAAWFGQQGLEEGLFWAGEDAQRELGGWERVRETEALVRDVETLLGEEPTQRIKVFIAGEGVKQAMGEYQAALGRGIRLLQERDAFRQKTAVQVSQQRYQDAAFRVFRNESLQKYRAQFDLSARYAYLAAAAYDYETGLLGSQTQSGQRFLTDIVKERILGPFACTAGGVCSAVPGNGLSGKLAQMEQSFDAVRVDLGFNAGAEFDRTFSLRWEMFRIPNTPEFDETWRQKLVQFQHPNINTLSEYLEFAQPLQGAPDPNPALVIPFQTKLISGRNFFGRPSTGDVTMPSDWFALRINEYGIRFEDYPGAPLNIITNVYVIPVGLDVTRVPLCSEAPIREWDLLDQLIPNPFPLSNDFESPTWQPWDSLSGGASGFVQRRLIPSVPACDFLTGTCERSPKLAGRSVWNTQWLLIIPESELAGSNEVDGVDVFINGAGGRPGTSDIKLLIKSNGYSGCTLPSLTTDENDDFAQPISVLDSTND